MALTISLYDGNIVCILDGLYNRSANSFNDQFETYEQPFYTNKITTITRLYLCIITGNQKIIDNINKQFDYYFESDMTNENGIQYLHQTILRELNHDQKYQICDSCFQGYLNGKISFDDIEYSTYDKKIKCNSCDD